MKIPAYKSVRPEVNIPQNENLILKFWDQENIFEKSVALSAEREKTAGNKTAKTYNFYDGPPFATGLPHYGHILCGVLKDVVPRYYTMKGYSVQRRFGWDCHGVPVEHEINKALKITSRQQVLEGMGVAAYNKECRSIVSRYSNEWKQTVRRTGRWVDMENAYFTMDVNFMQSVWWVFKQLWEKGLIYEGYKVVPYSIGISTVLSNFEASQNYKMVQDPAVTVSFPVKSLNNTSFLAWTTTPWTLPSNLGLAVGKEIDYAYVRTESGHTYILAEALVSKVFSDESVKVETLQVVKGSELLGMEYEPLFDFYTNKKTAASGTDWKKAFTVIWAEHVTTESGTGIVHMAPAFGEEDFYACKREGLPIVNPVDDDGFFTEEVYTYKGKRVKDLEGLTDKAIIADIKKMGRLVKHETLEHSYPFCWRSETPLIYRAVSSWFVAVEKIKPELLKANADTRWVPEHLRDGRFGNWLENARDWAISRNRFWGTPLPIWRNHEGEVVCISSREELEKLAGLKQGSVTDLHLDFIEKIEIPSKTGKSALKHIGDVLDCWFESGSMPFAQWGYPHSQAGDKSFLDRVYPANFIAEGLDQTRGWFYTLMVIGTALTGKAPYQNVVVNGLVLAEDGKKMSKSLRNYPDPMHVLEAHGADALRLYLIDSPVVRAQELRFNESGVRDIVRRILLRWWNAYSFFTSYALIDQFVPQGDAHLSPNPLDQWVRSRLHGLLAQTETEMAAYRLYNVVPAMLQFIEDLTNTYIRLNRSHFWKEGMPEDKRLAYETLYDVLFTLSKLMAPFAPFMSEVTYLNLKLALPEAQQKSSVHLEEYPLSNAQSILPKLEEAVDVLNVLVMLARNLREKIQVKAKIPLKTLKIIHRDLSLLQAIKPFEPYFKEELNIDLIEYASNEDDFVKITAKANFPVLGKRVGPKMKAVSAGIQKFTLTQILALEKGETLTLENETISLSDLEIRRAPQNDSIGLLVHQKVSIWVDTTVTPEQIDVGLAREVIRKVQAARKAADFNLDDRIALELKLSGDLLRASQKHATLIAESTLSKSVHFSAENSTPKGTHVSEADIDGEMIGIALTVVER